MDVWLEGVGLFADLLRRWKFLLDFDFFVLDGGNGSADVDFFLLDAVRIAGEAVFVVVKLLGIHSRYYI